MKRCAAFSLSCFLLLIMTGCWDKLELEKQSISLTYGFDIDKDGQLIVYQLNPIFNSSVSKTYEVYRVKAETARQAREVFASSSNGIGTYGKVQVLLFSEKMLKRGGAMPYLDVAYRNPKNTGNMRVVAVKGSVSSILNSEYKDKPMLPEYLNNVIDVNQQYNNAVFTTFQEFHRQSFDKGITPAISEIKKGEKDIVVTGSTLLTNQGVYKMSLDRKESALLLLLQKNAKPPVSLTIRMPSLPFIIEGSPKNIKGKNFVTINVMSYGRHLSTRYDRNHFAFDVKMKLNVSIQERTFNMNSKKYKEKLTAILTKQLNRDLNGLVKKIQKQQLDPFGYGEYARAFQYQHWKRVKNWPIEFSKATVTIKPTLRILDHGTIE